MTFDPEDGMPQAKPPPWWRRLRFRMPRWRSGNGTPAVRSRSATAWMWGWRIAVVVVLLYYPVGAMIVENIDDDPQFAPKSVAPGESRAVAVAADLVSR